MSALRSPARTVRRRLAGTLLFALAATSAAAPPGPAPAPAPVLLPSLRAAAPGLDSRVLAMALEARDCAARQGLLASDAQRLAVIDYTRPSVETRLWVFDLAKPGLLFAELVAHGRGTGDNLASRFSNDDGSHQSSLGLFRTAESYTGGNGYSLRMDGLEPGFNDHARDRSIVMHGAWYVDSSLAARQGRLGRSHGCPAVRPTIARPLIDSLKHGQLVFAYYPDPDWLARSQLLRCAPPGAGRERESSIPSGMR
jgi:hypothetical protein